MPGIRIELSEQAYNQANHLNNLNLEGVTVKNRIEHSDSLFGDPAVMNKIDPDLKFLTAEYFFYAEKVWEECQRSTDKLAWPCPVRN